MAKFDIDKKGYNTQQVDNYINTLTLKYEEKLSEQKDRVFSMRNELNVLNERVQLYQAKDKQISKALVYAVEKADQIEASARKLYDLELKRIGILYNKWEELAEEIEAKYGTKDGDTRVDALIEEFKKGLQSICEQNQKIAKTSVKQDIKNNSDSYIKNLLNKMDYVINKEPKSNTQKPKKQTTTLEQVHSKETTRVASISGRLQSLNVKMGSKTNGKGSPVDNYLSDGVDVELNKFGKSITRSKTTGYEPNESGFDMLDALNPKEDLDEIMKAFDFFKPMDNK